MIELIPQEVQLTPERLREVMELGGRAELTLRSRQTGAHVKVLLVAKKKNEATGRYFRRNSKEGRVGILDATKIDVTDPELEYPENRIGAFMLRGARFYADSRDPARLWAGEQAIRWMLGEFPKLGEQAEVFIADRCMVCGLKLTDPQSIERGIGPECYGRATASRVAARITGEDVIDAIESTRPRKASA